ncbi:MAG: hypothetical protein NC218_01880 [Acetobacter sp.]|nr:hypothetical protein [Acetobacter sp.]
MFLALGGEIILGQWEAVASHAYSWNYNNSNQLRLYGGSGIFKIVVSYTESSNGTSSQLTASFLWIVGTSGYSNYNETYDCKVIGMPLDFMPTSGSLISDNTLTITPYYGNTRWQTITGVQPYTLAGVY